MLYCILYYLRKQRKVVRAFKISVKSDQCVPRFLAHSGVLLLFVRGDTKFVQRRGTKWRQLSVLHRLILVHHSASLFVVGFLVRIVAGSDISIVLV